MLTSSASYPPRSFPEYTSSDNEDEEDTIDAPSVKSVFIVVYTLLAVSCIVGNGLVLVVMTRCPSMRTRTNIFLCHLAAADLGVGIICIVPSLLVGILATWFAGPMGLFLCKFYNFMEEFNLTVSILLHVLMALERYVAIIHPFFARRLFTRCRMYSILVIIWTAAGLHNLPLLFLYGTETTPSGRSYCFKFWTMNIDLPLYVTLNFVLTYLLPLICMSAMYIRISFVLWRSSPHKLLQPDTSTARFGNAHPSTERVSGVAAEGVNCASGKVSQVHGQSADRKYVPLTRTGDRRDNKDDTNVNDAALVTHTSNNSSAAAKATKVTTASTVTWGRRAAAVRRMKMAARL
ncbi:trissin receptor-like [Pomacea canaliculata]|nr:trissin receptor-like [Pomacea canaliculata]XP_025110873.1 trissin receptor-like [Pomacea canaliculata]